MWPSDENQMSNAWSTGHASTLPLQMQIQQMSTKIPPAFDGRSMTWFTYERLIDDWCDITELDDNKKGPALRNRLEGEAAVYATLLDRDRLKDHDGVQYFKSTLREHFVKGREVVFLWRFLQLFKMNRGNRDFIGWLGRLQVHLKHVHHMECGASCIECHACAGAGA